MLGELLNLLGMMFLLALFGFVAAKRGLVGGQGKKEPANLILYLILPCNILKAFCEDMSAQLLGKAMQMLLIACGVQLLCMAVSRLFYKRMREGEKQVYQYATVCANAACLLGRADPLVTGVSVLLTATPADSTTAILAARYGADEDSAAKCVAFTTLLSVMTIPVWSMLLLRGITG